MDTGVMAEAPTDLRKLVRRDVTVAAVGSVVAIWVASIMLVGHFGMIDKRTAATAVVAISAVLCFGCLLWWASGPRQYLRDRYLVLVPVFLVAPSTALALYDLGAGFAAIAISAAFGFGAAIAAGLALASRRG
jgi:hypothetical protein